MPPFLGRVPSPPDPRDFSIRSLAIVQATLPDLPTRYVVRSLRTYRARFDQRENSCVGQSSALAKIVHERRDHHRTYAFDPLWIWQRSKERDGIGDPLADRGTFIRTAAKVLQDLGAAAVLRTGTRVSGQDPARFRIASYYACQSIQEVKAAIVARGPVILGSDWFDAWFDVGPDGLLPDPGGAPSVGGHATLAYGFDDRIETWWGQGAVLAANSWGLGWANHGDFLIPYSLFGLNGNGRPFDEAWRLEDVIT